MRWLQSNHGFIFIHILFFHLVTRNPAIFLSSVWRLATCNKPCIKSQTTKAPWKPPIHYQTLWVEWLVTFKNSTWNLTFLTNFLTPKVAMENAFLWSLGSQQGKVTPFPMKKHILRPQNVPPSPSTWSLTTPKKTQWFKDVGFGVDGNSGLSWQVRI